MFFNKNILFSKKYYKNLSTGKKGAMLHHPMGSAPSVHSVSPNRLCLEQFMEKKTISDDTWNCVPNSEIHIQYFTPDNKEVGFINYRLSTGQIGLLFITTFLEKRYTKNYNHFDFWYTFFLKR